MHSPPTGHVHFDFAALAPRQRYRLLNSTIMPRPIALITSVSAEGRTNAAPFSFFNVFDYDPALIAVGIQFREDGAPKDTARNIIETAEFTVHICDEAMAQQMSIAAIRFGPETDEIAEAGFATVPGTLVRTPRIVTAPAALECRLERVIEVSDDRHIIFGNVLGIFIRDDAVDAATQRVDPLKIDAIGRLGGTGYTRTRDQFEMRTPTAEEYWAQKAAAK